MGGFATAAAVVVAVVEAAGATEVGADAVSPSAAGALFFSFTSLRPPKRRKRKHYMEFELNSIGKKRRREREVKSNTANEEEKRRRGGRRKRKK